VQHIWLKSGAVDGEAPVRGEMEVPHEPEPPVYPPVVVVDSPEGAVVPPLSSGLLSQAATARASETTMAPIARRDLSVFIGCLSDRFAPSWEDVVPHDTGPTLWIG